MTDKATGKETAKTVKVNHPLVVDGVAIYQASFGDGGSPLEFKAWNLAASAGATGRAGGDPRWPPSPCVSMARAALEFGELRVFNIEEMRVPVCERRSLAERMHDAREVKQEKNLKNPGPSITCRVMPKAKRPSSSITWRPSKRRGPATWLQACAARCPSRSSICACRWMQTRCWLPMQACAPPCWTRRSTTRSPVATGARACWQRDQRPDAGRVREQREMDFGAVCPGRICRTGEVSGRAGA